MGTMQKPARPEFTERAEFATAETSYWPLTAGPVSLAGPTDPRIYPSNPVPAAVPAPAAAPVPPALAPAAGKPALPGVASPFALAALVSAELPHGSWASRSLAEVRTTRAAF